MHRLQEKQRRFTPRITRLTQKKETPAGHIFISTNCGTRAADAKCPVAGISCGGAFLTSLGKEIKPQL